MTIKTQKLVTRGVWKSVLHLNAVNMNNGMNAEHVKKQNVVKAITVVMTVYHAVPSVTQDANVLKEIVLNCVTLN